MSGLHSGIFELRIVAISEQRREAMFLCLYVNFFVESIFQRESGAKKNIQNCLVPQEPCTSSPCLNRGKCFGVGQRSFRLLIFRMEKRTEKHRNNNIDHSHFPKLQRQQRHQLVIFNNKNSNKNIINKNKNNKSTTTFQSYSIQV